MKITAAIITYNEEEMIKDCLLSVQFADEIIVIDNFSKDKTKEIAEKYRAKVFQVQFDSFAKRREFAKDKASGDWIFYIDADERADKHLDEEIRSQVLTHNITAFALKRKNYYLGKPWPYEERVIRLFNKAKLLGWYGDIHESPKVLGEIGDLESKLLHYTHRDINRMVDKTNSWSEIEAKLRFTSHHPSMSWWRFFRVMITSFLDYYIKQRGYKVGTIGLIESVYQSFSTFITYSKLWEKQNKK